MFRKMIILIAIAAILGGCGVQAPANVPQYEVLSEEESSKGAVYKVSSRELGKQAAANITQDLAAQHAGDHPMLMVLVSHLDKLTLATGMFVADREAWNEYAVEEFQAYPDSYPVVAVKTTYDGGLIKEL
jgi:hypothetical protein